MNKLSKLQHDRAEIERALAILAPQGVVEVRAAGQDKSATKAFKLAWSGFYDANDPDNRAKLARDVCSYLDSERVTAVWVTLNPCKPGLLARAANRIQQGPKFSSTANHEIESIRWLPFDWDPKRETGISSTDEEKACAEVGAKALQEALRARGWPEGLLADSGNGFHLLYRVDLRADESGLIERVLKACAEQFAAGCDFDTGNHNPARIWKLYGTVARKGDEIPGRPHRLSRIVSTPDAFEVVTREQLEALVTELAPPAPATDSPPAPPPKPKRSASPIKTTGHKARLALDAWTVEGWAAEVGLVLPSAQDFVSHSGRGRKWKLEPCPCPRGCPDGAALQQAGDGTLSFTCHHNNCSLRSWDDLRAHLGDPKPEPPPHRPTRAPRAAVTPAASPASPPPTPADIPDADAPDLIKLQPSPTEQLRAAFDAVKMTREAEGIESTTTLTAWADLVGVVERVWAQLEGGMHHRNLLAPLFPLTPELTAVWLRRAERAVEGVRRQAEKPGWRTDDDRAADFLLTIAAEDGLIEGELACAEEPWRVALSWALRADEGEREGRLRGGLARVLTEWGKFIKADVVGVLESALTAAEFELVPERFRPKAKKKSKEKTGDKGQDTAASSPTPAAPIDHRQRVCDVWPGARVPESAVIPAGYFVADGVLVETDPNRDSVRVVSHRPMLIEALSEDQHGFKWRDVAWLEDKKWEKLTVPTSVIADRTRLVELSRSGLPSNSSQGGGQVLWLAAFEAANRDVLPRYRVTTQMGWCASGGFMLGTSYVAAGDEMPVSFHPRDSGDKQESAAFSVQTQGTLEGWLSAVQIASPFPAVMLSLFASLAAPLVSLLGHRTIILDWAGPSSSGKTRLMMFAASVWGDPNDNGGSSSQVIQSWDTTLVALERLAAARCHLPVLLNDSKKATRLDLGSVPFLLAEGVGRSRGTATGLQAQLGWQTVILSNGEERLADYAKSGAGGVRARVLSLHGLHWGGQDAIKREVVSRFRAQITQHWGHAGGWWVAWLAQNRAEKLKSWRERWLKIATEYEAKAGDNDMGARLGADMALLKLTAELTKEVFGIDGVAHVDALWSQILDEHDGAPVHHIALRDLYGWCVSHSHRMFNQADYNPLEPPTPPHQGWAGRWDRRTGKDERTADTWQEIAFIAKELDKILFDLGYVAPASVRAMWEREGWLKTKATNKPADGKKGAERTLNMRICGQVAKCVVIRRDAFMKIVGLGASPSAQEVREAEEAAEEAEAKREDEKKRKAEAAKEAEVCPF
jgi:hypothetical protein